MKASSILTVVVFLWSLTNAEKNHSRGKPREIRGVVLDSETKQPIPDVWVSFPPWHESQNRIAADQTDTYGNFSLKIPRQTDLLRFYKHSYIPLTERLWYTDISRLPDTVYLKKDPRTAPDLVAGPSTFVACKCEPVPPVVGTSLSSFAGCEERVNAGVPAAQRPTEFYGRKVSENCVEESPGDICIGYDSLSGLPSEIRGGNIHVSEFSTFDTVSVENASEVAACFLRQNAHFLGIRLNEWKLVSAWDHDATDSRGIPEIWVVLLQVIGQARIAESRVNLMFANDQLVKYRGHFQPVGSLDVVPSVSAESAFQSGKRTQEEHLEKLGYPGCVLECRTVELQVYVGDKAFESKRRKPRLVWAIKCCDLYSPPIDPTLIIDAHSGKLIRSKREGLYCGLSEVRQFMFYESGD